VQKNSPSIEIIFQSTNWEQLSCIYERLICIMISSKPNLGVTDSLLSSHNSNRYCLKVGNMCLCKGMCECKWYQSVVALEVVQYQHNESNLCTLTAEDCSALRRHTCFEESQLKFDPLGNRLYLQTIVMDFVIPSRRVPELQSYKLHNQFFTVQSA